MSNDVTAELIESALSEFSREDDGYDLYELALEESIDWDEEGDQSLALLFESEAVALTDDCLVGI